jgi:hypothetical protein
VVCCGHTLLKCHRLARGWDIPTAIDQILTLAAEEHITGFACAPRSLLDWEAGAGMRAQTMDLLCRLYRTGPVQLGLAHDYSPVLPDPGSLSEAAAPDTAGGDISPRSGGQQAENGALVQAPPLQDRCNALTGPQIERMVMMTARESADFTRIAGQTNVGPFTIEQYHADVARLALSYPYRPVGPSFTEAAELRDRAFDLLEGRQYPEQARELYMIAGRLCGMLANASFDLGYMDAATTHARTAFLCGELAGHHGLRCWVRGMQSLIAYWTGHLSEAVALARSGWDFLPEQGTARIRVAALEARVHGRRNDHTAMVDALNRVDQARQQSTADDEPGGMFAFPMAKQVFYTGTAYLWLGTDPWLRRAETTACDALALYEDTPADQRRLGEVALARLDIAVARLGRDDLDGADEELRTVMETSARRRTDCIIRRLRQVASIADRPRYREIVRAHQLREEIADFCSTGSAVPVRAIDP